MEEKIYRVDVSMQFYIKADNEVIAKVNAIHRIKNKLANDKGFKMMEVDLPDDLKEFYFGEKDNK